MKVIGNLLGLKKALKKKDLDVIKAIPIEILPVAEASYDKSAKKELQASMGNSGKMSATHLKIPEELIIAKDNYRNNGTTETREQLLNAMINQALPIIEEITSLKKGLEASNQVCPNLDRYISVVKAQLGYNAAGNNTLLLGSAILRLNDIEKNTKTKVQTPSISKNELDANISRILSPTGLIKEEIQIFDQEKYNKLKSIHKFLATVKFDPSGRKSIAEVTKNFNAKKGDTLNR